MSSNTARTAGSDGPLRLGDPEADPGFEFNACHNYMIVEDYVTEFELFDEGGERVSQGRKESFCMADSERYLDEPEIQTLPTFSCYRQGITRGWMDHYANDLPCQWVDITDLPPGNYELVIRRNPNRLFNELDYENNTSRTSVMIPEVVLDSTCSARNLVGLARNCEWRMATTEACEGGSDVRVGCGSVSECESGSSCEGDPMLRICAGNQTHCDAGASLAQLETACGEACGSASFSCPETGWYTVWTANEHPDEAATCDTALR